MSTLQKRLAFQLLILNVAFCLSAEKSSTSWAAEAAPTNRQYAKYDLCPDGLIANWLVLGYLPGVQAPESDRLASIGGEATVAPCGGETVALKGQGEKKSDLNLTWKFATVKNPELPFFTREKGVYLFTDEKGNLIRNAQAYAYCELLSESDQEVVLWMCGGEPIRIVLNGQPVEITNRTIFGGDVGITLKKGVNRLLVRIDNKWDDDFLSMRLGAKNGKPVTNVQVQLKTTKDCPELSQVYQIQDWKALTGEIPPLAKAQDEERFGANLHRTMMLLETSGQTKRPVRILFYGQSITASTWPYFVVRRLRDLYPDAIIEAENLARSGWGLDMLNLAIKHDILRARPDLVVLHAYTGSPSTWESILQQIRRETSADIMVRTAHVAGPDMKPYYEKGMPKIWENDKWKERPEPYDKTKEKLIPEDDPISVGIREMANKYGCEMVECRKEWLSYIRSQGLMDRLDLLSDGLHLNRKGCILMAEMYVRHFRKYPTSQPLSENVRTYEAVRPSADASDGIRLVGDGWNIKDGNGATSTGKEDMLKLTFRGNRVDLIMPPCSGKAKILIDGKTPTEWNLLQGYLPGSKGPVPSYLMAYEIGKNAVAEDWTLKFTHLSGDYGNIRYTLTGSKTGFDGEGSYASNPFVSNSGRITIQKNAYNWNINVRNLIDRTKKELEPAKEEMLLTWSLRQPFPDVVSGVAQQEDSENGNSSRYLTVIDGLPEGKHELTIIPEFSEKKEHFSIKSVEIHCPPLWKKGD